MTAETNVEVPDFASISDSDDPFAVIYVVNDSRDDEGNIASERDILQASSDALFELLSSKEEAVMERVHEWESGRIRKIVKRARASAWDKANAVEFPHIIAEYNGAKVIIFVPMRISEQPKDLKKLQVTGLNSTNTSPAEIEEEAHLLVRVNDSLNMSTGKIIAQVGHAVQLFLTYADPEEVKDFIVNGSFLKVVRAENLDESQATGIIVHDAGFTEVPSGSLTATADYRFKTEGNELK